MSEPGRERQRIHVSEIFDGELTLRRPLAHAASTAAIVTGCRITATIDPRWANDPTNLTDHLDQSYELRWSYDTTDGTMTVITTADLVRVPQRVRVTPDDVERRFPGFSASGIDPIDAIAEAFELVRRDVATHRTIQRARDAGALRELAIIRAHVVALEYATLFRGAPTSALAAAEDRYRARLAELVAAQPVRRVVSSPARRFDDVRPEVDQSRTIEAFKEWFTASVHTGDAVEQFIVNWLPRVLSVRRECVLVIEAHKARSAGAHANLKRMLHLLAAPPAMQNVAPDVDRSRLIEEFKEWVIANMDKGDLVYRYIKEWRPRLDTDDLRRQAAMVVRAYATTTKQAYYNRIRMLGYIEPS